MVVGDFHAIFDANTYKEFMNIVGKGNIRRSFEDYMLNVIASKNQDIDGINLQILDLEIEKIQQNLSKIQAELQKKMVLREKIESLHNQKEQERLKAEAERIEKETHCPNCHIVLTDKNKRGVTEGIFLCRSCSYDRDVVKRYLKK